MTTQEIARQWIEDAQQRIVKQYNDLHLDASRNFEEKIENRVVPDAFGLSMAVIGVDYSYYMKNGRGPNKDQSKEGLRKWVGWYGANVLEQWVIDKGLSISPFAVAYKIAKKGILVPNKYNSGALLATAATDEELISLGRSIADIKSIEIRRGVINTLKNNGNN